MKKLYVMLVLLIAALGGLAVSACAEHPTAKKAEHPAAQSDTDTDTDIDTDTDTDTDAEKPAEHPTEHPR